MLRKTYPTDLTDQQWSILKPLVPDFFAGSRPRTAEIHAITNPIFYIGIAE